MLVSSINSNGNQLRTSHNFSKSNSIDSTKNSSVNNSPTFQHIFNAHNPVDVIGLAAVIIIILRAYYNRRSGR